MIGSSLLESLGAHIRSLRRQAGLSQKELSLRSGVSARFLARLEAGTNVSVLTLFQIAEALSESPSGLLARAESLSPLRGGGARHLALIGLRGAGKSTVGRLLAARTGRPFIELDERIEEAAGLSLGEIFALHGESYYRKLEREVLTRLLSDGEVGRNEGGGVVLAVGGGLVTDEGSYALLRRRALTVWLRARPEDHWNRVVLQGDRRPMEGSGAHSARAQLEDLLRAREPLYEQAHLALDTSLLGIEGTVSRLEQLFA